MAPAPRQVPTNLSPSQLYQSQFQTSPTHYFSADIDRPHGETSRTPFKDNFSQSETFQYQESIPCVGTEGYPAYATEYSFHVPGTGFNSPSTPYQSQVQMSSSRIGLRSPTTPYQSQPLMHTSSTGFVTPSTPYQSHLRMQPSGYEVNRDVHNGIQSVLSPPMQRSDGTRVPRQPQYQPAVPDPTHGRQLSQAFQFGLPIVEKETDHKNWAIRRCLPNENPRCAAVIRRNGQWEMCGRNIKALPDASNAAPSFYGTMEQGYKKSFQIYWFCGASVRGCVSTDHVQMLRGGKPPPLPRVWPVETGTMLSAEEANSLGRGGFALVEKYGDPLVGQGDRSQRYHTDVSTPAKSSPQDPLKRPSRRCGKKVNRRSLTVAGETRRKEGLMMTAQVQLLSEDPATGTYRFGLNTISRTFNKPVCYIVTISDTPACNCPFFVSSVADSKNGYYFMTCKHMYHVYNVVLGLPLEDERPHQATLSREEVDEIMRSSNSMR